VSNPSFAARPAERETRMRCVMLRCHVTMSSPTNGGRPIPWKLLRQSVNAAGAVAWKLRVLLLLRGHTYSTYDSGTACIAAIAWSRGQWPSSALLHVSPFMGHQCVGIESEGAVSGGDWAIAPRGASQQPSTTMLRNPAASGPAVVPRATIYSARQTHQFTYSKKFRRHTQYATQ